MHAQLMGAARAWCQPDDGKPRANRFSTANSVRLGCQRRYSPRAWCNTTEVWLTAIGWSITP